MSVGVSQPSRSLSGVLWMMLGSGGQAIFQFGLFIVLARQLDPEAFGIIAIAAVFIELSGTIGRAGLTEVAIQQSELDDKDASTAFWSSFGIGLLFTGVLLASSGSVAGFFSMPALKPVMEWLAPISFLYALGAVYEAKLRRTYGFRALAARNVSATLVSGVVALVMAVTGFGVFSLVAQRLIHVVCLLLAMIYATRWTPSLTWKRRTALRQLSHGGTIALSSLVGTGALRVTDLLVGFVLGARDLGYFRIAMRAIEMILEVSVAQIITVTLTSFSRLQHSRDEMAAAAVKLVRTTAAFAYPLFAGAAVAAEPIIHLLFGSKWQPSVQPMQILCAMAIFLPPIFYRANALIAVGAQRMLLQFNLIEFGLTAATAYVFAQFGVTAAAIGTVVRFALATPIYMLGLRRAAGIPVAATLDVLSRPLLATLIMVGCLSALSFAIAGWPPLAALALLGVTGLAVYAGALYLLDREQVLEIFRMAKQIARRG